MADITEAYVDEFLLNAKLMLRHDIYWVQEYTHYKFKVPVENEFESNIQLLLIGTKNIYVRDYSYCLLLNNNRIRSFDPFKSHKNNLPNDKRRIEGSHKHKWCDITKDKNAYVPTDITNPEDMELSLRQFMNECNIRFYGRITMPPPSQFQLPT